MKELKKKYGSKGFEILGVAVDDKKTLTAFFEKKGGVPWKNVLDPEGEITDRLEIEAFPTYFLIDRSGKHVASPRHASEIEAALEDLL